MFVASPDLEVMVDGCNKVDAKNVISREFVLVEEAAIMDV